MIVGEWQVDAASNRIAGPAGEVELEPRVMDLLMLFAKQPGRVFSKDEIASALWADVHVNDDALTRSVFKLRKALGDDARDARYIATVPKRGYRLIADVAVPGDNAAPRAGYWRAVWFAAAISIVCVGLTALFWGQPWSGPESSRDLQAERIARADGFYNQFNRTDNEAALRLYENILEADPDNTAALAGYANALTQRVIRYEGTANEGAERKSVTEALESGWLDRPQARANIDRAISLARLATEAAPSHARAWRALGLALSTRGEFQKAERAYERALVIDPDDWGSMLNLAELSNLSDHPERSVPYLEQAWLAMERKYDEDPVAIRPWHSNVGIQVAQAKTDAGAFEDAELWYRRVLAFDPLNPDAVRGLADLLNSFGDPAGAEAMCIQLEKASDESC
ncbi:winged helix-turn-helix domain-containing protein [Hyphomonas sp. GM-8P]|uniref:winged helix-turn-helix domain-containing protein n=1 Tax=Hyphomonas sp. GM-8P TaxID=1280945 RepID=UPI000DC01B9E|nr:winged helix-turn-helix domain-containing protein [Hyphomonas sp. GM-8P]RAN41225.1 hypothetical protein HY26_10135 [Hyphomonas sp. GM-8P]